MRRRPQLGMLALVAALVFGAAGCGEDSPKPGPVAKSSASPSPETEAMAAAIQWIKALNTSARTLDATELERLSSPNCNPCQIITQYITEIGKRGGYVEGGEWNDPQLTVGSSSASRVVVDAQVTVSPQRVKEGSKAKVKTFPGGKRVPKRLTLEKRPTGWIVTDLAQEDTL